MAAIGPVGALMTFGQALLVALALYAAMGALTGVAFVSFGAQRVLGTPASFTLGARLLLLPASAALWPYVLIRWLKARSAPRSAPGNAP